MEKRIESILTSNKLTTQAQIPALLKLFTISEDKIRDILVDYYERCSNLKSGDSISNVTIEVAKAIKDGDIWI